MNSPTPPVPTLVSLTDPNDEEGGEGEGEVLDFCCKKRKCPKLVDEGDFFVIEDPDQSPMPIRLTREQGERVKTWLGGRLSVHPATKV